MEELRYPTGRFSPTAPLTPEERARAIDDIEAAPGLLRAAVEGLSDAQLDTPYRPGGWTVRQVVHHVADSHLNSYVRFRWTLTEDAPTIKVYDESLWAELPDARSAPIELSLTLLDAVHARWLVLLRAMTPEQFQRTLVHPEYGRVYTLDEMLQMYRWHGKHHTAHVTRLREREGW